MANLKVVRGPGAFGGVRTLACYLFGSGAFENSFQVAKGASPSPRARGDGYCSPPSTDPAAQFLTVSVVEVGGEVILEFNNVHPHETVLDLKKNMTLCPPHTRMHLLNGDRPLKNSDLLGSCLSPTGHSGSQVVSVYSPASTPHVSLTLICMTSAHDAQTMYDALKNPQELRDALEYGVDPNVLLELPVVAPDAGRTDLQSPLYLAAELGNIECVRLLAEAGAELNPPELKFRGPDFTYQNALHAAILAGNVEMVECLVNNVRGGPDALSESARFYDPASGRLHGYDPLNLIVYHYGRWSEMDFRLSRAVRGGRRKRLFDTIKKLF